MDRDVIVYQCSFELYVEKATVSIKFPCSFFLQWKLANGKKTAEGKCRPTSINNVVTFQQALQLTTQMIFDNNTKQFTKKETMVNLNLISKSRQDQSKLVGRVAVDLSSIANYGQYNEIKSYKLAYCSVDGEILFSTVMKSKRKTNLSPQDLDKSSFNEYLSFYTGQNREPKTKKDDRESNDQQTSIGYGRRINQNVIDSQLNEIKNNPRQHQTFYVLQSPRQKSAFNVTNQTNRASKQRSIGTQTALTNLQRQQMPSLTQVGKGFGRVSVAAKNIDANWQQDKIKFRDEIDTNRQKIGQMQKKIMQLYTNLEDSKRHIEFAQRQNREKQEIIKKLKDNAKSQEEPQVNQWRQKYYTFQKEAKEEIYKYRQSQDSLRKQIQQNQVNFQNLRRQTQELRKIWIQKRQHSEEKLKKVEDLVRQKQNKINELCRKNEEMTKFKYQNQMLKALSMEKQSKLKLLERDLSKLSDQFNELKKNNLAQENYKIKLQNAQSLKKIQEITKQIQKCNAQIQKYRQNYIKIQTAYEIQTKTYENTKQKYNTLENSVFSLQKQNIQLKNSVQNSNKIFHQTQKKYLEIYANFRKLQSQCEEVKAELENVKNLYQNIKKERDSQGSLIEKMKIEEEVRKQDFQKQLKRIQMSFVSSLEHKQKSYNLSKKDLQNNIADLKQLISCQQKQNNSKIQQIQQQLDQTLQQLTLSRQEVLANLNRIKTLQETIVDKQEIIKLSKQENQALKSNNSELVQSLTKMRQTQKRLQENIIILQEESQKIIYILEQKEETDRKNESLKSKLSQLLNERSQLIQKCKEIEICMQQQKNKNIQLLKSLEQRDHEREFKQQEIKSLLLKIQDINTQNSTMREEWLDSKTQINKLKQIIKEINERYEQHIKIEERYIQQINTMRQEKQEIEVLLNQNNNQLVSHNQQLENRIIELQNAVQKFESCVESQEEERKELQSIIQDSDKLQNQQKAKEEQLKIKIQILQKQIQNKQSTNHRYQSQIEKLSTHLKQLQVQLTNCQLKNSELVNILTQKDTQLKNYEEKIQQNYIKVEQKANQISQLERKIGQLQRQITNLVQQTVNRNSADPKQSQSKSLFEGQHQITQREQQLQQLLFESDRKNEALQERIISLTAQCELSKQQKSQDRNQIYDSFNQFQREQMAKIIEEQRLEIDRIQNQLKQRKTTDSSVLEKRIAQLQAHIVQLQSSFKAQIDRILGEQLQKQVSNSINGGLSVIHEECSEEDMYKSERSLFGSPSRVKSSFQLVELYQMREKLQLLQQQKQQLEQQFNVMEQQKFNLLSTINQKDIELEQLGNLKISLQTEIDQLRNKLQNSIQKCKYLEYQTQSLKNQLTFGSTINFNINEHSVTRSEPILNSQDQSFSNKNIQIQNLKAEIEKHKNRQEELMWNIKDLEMQLETVTQNLNLLNGSSMNSVLSGSNKKIQSDDQKQEKKQKRQQTSQGYSKQKLLLQLKKNEELKQLSHNLIRVLKQRQKKINQQKMSKDMQNFPFQNYKIQAINQKIDKLLTDFQTIKVYVMKSQSGKLKEQASRILGEMKNVEIMKGILAFEEELKSVRAVNEPNQQLIQMRST